MRNMNFCVCKLDLCGCIDLYVNLNNLLIFMWLFQLSEETQKILSQKKTESIINHRDHTLFNNCVIKLG